MTATTALRVQVVLGPRRTKENVLLMAGGWQNVQMWAKSPSWRGRSAVPCGTQKGADDGPSTLDGVQSRVQVIAFNGCSYIFVKVIQ